MFCTINPFNLTQLSNTLKPNQQLQKLSSFLGQALRHSILSFKQKRNVGEKQILSIEKSISLTKMSQSEEKLQKSEMQIAAGREQGKEIAHDCQSQEDKKTGKDQQLQSDNKKDAVSKPKRRINRKIKRLNKRVKVKKQQNMFKYKNPIREDFITLTATIPPVRLFLSRQIEYRVQQLKRRQVTSWEGADPITQRRKRFLKHLE